MEETQPKTNLQAPNREAEINFMCQIFTGIWVTNPDMNMGELFVNLFPHGTDIEKVSDQEVLDSMARLLQAAQTQE